MRRANMTIIHYRKLVTGRYRAPFYEHFWQIATCQGDWIFQGRHGFHNAVIRLKQVYGHCKLTYNVKHAEDL